jgi:hypothetical protein
VTVDGGEHPVRASLLDGPERARVWPRVLDAWPAYATYEDRSGRELRVFRLERGPSREARNRATTDMEPA